MTNNIELIKPFIEQIDMEWSISDIDLDSTPNSFKLNSSYRIIDAQYQNIVLNLEYNINKSWVNSEHESIIFQVNEDVPNGVIIATVPLTTTNSFAYSECKIIKNNGSYVIVTNGNVYSVKISDYFYNKIEKIDNDFSNEEITEYELDVTNNKINISTTSKLINYLKSLIVRNNNNLNTELDKKLNISDYIVDDEFKENSLNPVSNSIIVAKYTELKNKFNEKANLIHTHSMNDIDSLNSTITTINDNIDSKASGIDLTNHKNNKSNPHAVTKAQVGLGNVQNLSIYVGSFSKTVKANDYEYVDINSGFPQDRKGKIFIACNNNVLDRDARIATNNIGSFQIWCRNGSSKSATISGYWLWIG